MNNKSSIFDSILDTIESEDIRKFAERCIQTIPDYFWDVGASSTGRYHPQYALGDLGLARHTCALVRFLNHIFAVKCFGENFTQREKDLMRVAGMMHDSRKSGSDEDFQKNKYTRFNHPLLASEVIRNLKGHELSDDEVEMIATTIESHMGEFDYIHKRMTEQLKKKYENQKRYPEEFIKEFSLAASRGEVAWEKAKNASDFDVFKPALEKIVDLTKKSIEYKGYEDNKYDALLDDYEAGLTVNKLDKVFGELRDGIVEILNKIKVTGKTIDDSFFHNHFPKSEQESLSLKILDLMGFDFKRGRMDETEHPYTLDMTNKDVRITNHYYENDFTSALFSAIHEGGHALYEQDIPDLLEGTGLNVASSMAVHESQSRFYENIIGKSREFSNYLQTSDILCKM